MNFSSWFPFAYSNQFLSGVDSVGTVSASLVTYASIQALKPDLIINAGTAGAFKVCALLFRKWDFLLFYLAEQEGISGFLLYV